MEAVAPAASYHAQKTRPGHVQCVKIENLCNSAFFVNEKVHHRLLVVQDSKAMTNVIF